MWVGSYLLVVLGLFDIIVGVWLFKPENFWEELHRGAYIKVPEWVKPIIKYIAPLYVLILLGKNTWDYFNNGTITMSQKYLEYLVNNEALISTTTEYARKIVIESRAVIILVLIIGAIEAYMAIKKKYGEELEKNEVIIKL
ncbi:MAG: neurotransmitter:Na+ symporter, family [Thermococcaceae archaeon]|nr:neurotransmitter:Na+ symporter, family [Thermococcaceae archaeon]